MTWPTGKLSALRLGKRLVAEVPAAGPGRRAFVDLRPGVTAFTLVHWDYDADLLEGFDHDIGAVRVRDQIVSGEPDLVAAVEAWGLRPEDFRYPWETAAP
jgi:hypothetical protein